MKRYIALIISLILFIPARAFAADVEADLDSADGSTAFEVQDSGSTAVATIDSDGNMVVKGGMRIDSGGVECTTAENLIVDGNIGIGTTAPGARLHIGAYSSAEGLRVVGSVAGALVEFEGASGNKIVSVQQAGNVGIGTTAPTSKLHVVGDITATGNVYGSGSDELVGLQGSTPGTAQTGNTNVSGTGLFGGNVGIGTTSPTAKLQIKAGAAANVGLRVIGPTSGNVVEFQDDSGNELLTLKTGGNLGIGTSSPTATLDVDGSLSKNSGSFDIPHPDPAKASEGWHLRHSFVESPTRGDNIYRWRVDVEGGSAVITLPDYFSHLNENVQVWAAPKGHFGKAEGEINEGFTEIKVTADSDGSYNVLAIGTRKDNYATEWFDELGVEYKAVKE